MAILANRVKQSNKLIEFIRFILVIIKRFFALVLVIISLYLFIAAPQEFSAIPREITGYFLSKGFLICEDKLKQINIIIHKFVFLQNLVRENIELQLEVARFQRMQNNINTIQAENIALKKLLLVVEREQYNYVTAKLLSVALNPYSKTALVTAGTNHGIKVNQVVTNSEGLVGRVVKVSNNYSRIMLTNDVNSRIPITILPSGEKGILIGNGDNSKILYLRKNHLIQKGETVITSGSGSIYPYGITVGYVSKVLVKDIFVQSIVDLSKTEFVNILLPSKDIELISLHKSRKISLG